MLAAGVLLKRRAIQPFSLMIRPQNSTTSARVNKNSVEIIPCVELCRFHLLNDSLTKLASPPFFSFPCYYVTSRELLEASSGRVRVKRIKVSALVFSVYSI